MGYCIYFAQPDVLKGTLVNTLKEVLPTVFFGVPRVYEKIMEKMLAIGESKPKAVRCIVSWAKSIGTRASQAQQAHQPMPWGFTLANFVLFSNIRCVYAAPALWVLGCGGQSRGFVCPAPWTAGVLWACTSAEACSVARRPCALTCCSTSSRCT